ncbi:hypothetical protein BH23ACT9_BH23ACT9_14540 [soil metagenome]
MADPIPFADVLLDVERILRALTDNDVAYVVCGGIAAQLAGSPLTTEDLDFTPADDPDNLDRCAAALNALGAQWRVPGLLEGFPPPAPLAGPVLAGKMSLAFVTTAGFLDLVLIHSDGARYGDMAADAAPVNLYGISVQIASLASIISAKQAAGRDKDVRALPFLHELHRRRGDG